MNRYFIIYKPYLVLSQFSSSNEHHKTLKDFFSVPKDVYPIGRLDNDSEGLLIISNDAALNHQLLNPSFQHEREYWVQVDGAITSEAIHQMEKGVWIEVNGKPYFTNPAKATLIEPAPIVAERNPPVRFRKEIPTSWISLVLTEGKNRQVRKMTAKVGFPTLRLIRYRIETIELGNMQPGEIKELSRNSIYKKLFNEK